MREGIPSYLAQLICAQYGEETAERIAQGFEAKRKTTLRANRLKSDVASVRAALEGAGVSVKSVAWSEDALVLEDAREDAVTPLSIYENGEIYMQSLSSMIPPIVLDAKPEESVLDMAAAPGGKTTQIAALTGNKAQITACERHAARAERMKYNLQKQGATRVSVMNIDSRQLDDMFRFDRILLDAPCSGSGTIQLCENSRARFTKEYLDKIAKTQEALLIKALTLLKPGHEMVYSTCSILERENEEIVRRAMKKTGAQIVPVDTEMFSGVPLLPVTLEGTMCVCPSEEYEGFFVARLRRTK
ncbi:MAG: RsmB/NOP family class I SAM-dependent RNA methyltransferase [Clostridia bacterium]|nr:RsmB/NOP family class I SAM-dependent RNA methyltransferase [Clostridia bacterium]